MAPTWTEESAVELQEGTNISQYLLRITSRESKCRWGEDADGNRGITYIEREVVKIEVLEKDGEDIAPEEIPEETMDRLRVAVDEKING